MMMSRSGRFASVIRPGIGPAARAAAIAARGLTATLAVLDAHEHVSAVTHAAKPTRLEAEFPAIGLGSAVPAGRRPGVPQPGLVEPTPQGRIGWIVAASLAMGLLTAGALVAAPFSLILLAALTTQIGTLQIAPVAVAVLTSYLAVSGSGELMSLARKRDKSSGATT